MITINLAIVFLTFVHSIRCFNVWRTFLSKINRLIHYCVFLCYITNTYIIIIIERRPETLAENRIIMSAQIQGYLEQVEKLLHEKNKFTEVIALAEQKTGVKRLYIVSGEAKIQTFRNNSKCRVHYNLMLLVYDSLIS